MAKNGVFIPKTNIRNILKVLSQSLLGREVEGIIIVGDIKNDFSDVSSDEINEMRELIGLAAEKRITLTLIKGNHDNFIERYSTHFKIQVRSAGTQIGDYLFAHGDKALPASKVKRGGTIIIGHEHPSIGIPTKVGRTERLRCFLYGKYGGSHMLVLPAIGYFETGRDVNSLHGPDVLSPILRATNVGKMRAIAFGYGSTMDFGSILDLQKLSRSQRD